MGFSEWNTATAFLQTGLRTVYPSATVTAGAAGTWNTSQSHGGGGGGGGVVISNVAGIPSPSGTTPTSFNGTPSTAGTGWGAGGGASGYNGNRGTTGQGAQGFVVIWPA
jgi:hypothetical protein